MLRTSAPLIGALAFMDLSLALSLISLVLAAGAVAYAKASADAASRANEIAIHGERLKVFHGMLELRTRLTAHGTKLSDRRLFELHDHFVLCEFYFPERIHKLATKFFETAREMNGHEMLIEATENHDQRSRKVHQAHDALKQARGLADELEEAMKAYLRLEKE